MTSDPEDPNKEDIIAVDLTDADLENVDGGITLDNGIKHRASVKGLSLAGVNNDTLFAGVNHATIFAGFTGDKTFKRR